ncbi:D-cysteine desulfhydrase family protein [Azospirillum argentinense]|uniref:D-cysteine desulfhydrase family protein n=1 Tax=Azospirillum argentinense TaxID=2970906 RepID=A0ABW8VHL5_9PROT
MVRDLSFPRVPVSHRPTPLEPLERLSAHLGGPLILAKRDDCTGLALGGNKARKLDFLIGDALAQGADTVITPAGLQSNHARQTAAAAAKVGLKAVLVLARVVDWPDPAYGVSGNLLLDRLLGAEIRLVEPAERAAGVQAAAEEARANGGRPYVIASGGSSPVGALGYVEAAREIAVQAAALDHRVAAVVTASGSGGTQAGLVAGFSGIDGAPTVIGVGVDDVSAVFAAQVRGLAVDTARLAGLPEPDPGAVELLGAHLGPGYGLPAPETLEAITLAARLEGLVLDPVYTGKAMAGLIAQVRTGRFAADEAVVFVHTGGGPGLFAYPSLFG